MAGFSTSRGLFGAPMMQDRSAPGAGPIQQDAVVPTYKKPSTGQLIAGTIGDALQNWSGGRGTFLPAMQQQREMAQQAQMYQQQRADKFTDWKAQQDYERANPGPAKDDVFTRDLMRAGIDPNSADGIAKYRAKVDNTTDPQVVVPLPNGTYIGPKSGLAAALGGGRPSAPVAQAPRTLPADFDFGGPASSAPATFR